MTNNILLNTDSYKASHYLQYPPGTEFVESYIESRGGEYDYTLFHGLQAFIKEYLLTPISLADIDEAEEVFATHGLPFNRSGWERVLNHHHGFLPITIKAVKEGTIVPTHNVLVTIRNTDPELPWLTSYLETALLRAVWYPTTVATISHSIKQIIKESLERTGDITGLPFKLHDFGARGVSSLESSAIGGTAHLVNFLGTDNVPALIHARKYYDCKMAGFSIPAAEHSTITSWGRTHELSAYDNMLKQFAKPGAIVAVVSDSYDLWNAISNMWGMALKQKIIDSGATVVIRPDSGDPATVVLRCLRLLEESFGTTTNSLGYKVLNNVRVIQGDGINEDSIKKILSTINSNGYSTDNIAFGMGGALLQHMNRDTMRFAQKASSITIKGEDRQIFKDPVTDKGKASKKGRQMLYKNTAGEYYTSEIDSTLKAFEQLDVVYQNGLLLRKQTLDNIRSIANG